MIRCVALLLAGAAVCPPEQTHAQTRVTTNTPTAALRASGKTKASDEEAEKNLRKALALHPCDRKSREGLVNLLKARERKKEALSESQAWIAACPADAVEAHRFYQILRLGLEEREPLVEEYRARLAAHPDSAANHYLYGRLLEDPEISLPEFERALRLDPDLVRARVALGQDLLALERYREAFEVLSRAVASPDCDPGAANAYACAAVGAGLAATAEAGLEPLARRYPGDPVLENARRIIAFGQPRRDRAEEIVRSILRANSSSVWGWYLQARILQRFSQRQELERFLEASSGRKELAVEIASLRFELQLEDGQFRAAATELKRRAALGDSASLSASYSVYAAAALLMDGDRPGARDVLKDLEYRLKHDEFAPEAIASFHAMAEALRGNLPPDQVLKKNGAEYVTLKDALFTMGACARAQGDRSAARALFARSARACLHASFPEPVARKLAAE